MLQKSAVDFSAIPPSFHFDFPQCNGAELKQSFIPTAGQFPKTETAATAAQNGNWTTRHAPSKCIEGQAGGDGFVLSLPYIQQHNPDAESGCGTPKLWVGREKRAIIAGDTTKLARVGMRLSSFSF